MMPFFMPHMTSFSPLPMLSFATAQYDWEWKYSEGDVQNRFARDLLLLTSTGELAGTWPVPLHDHGGQVNNDWIQRTFTAVRILHELDGFGGFGHTSNAAQKKARDGLARHVLAMLDKPGLQVYKYWQDRPQPAVTDDPELPTIVYSVPGQEALVAVVSYADQDRQATLKLDMQALGFAKANIATATNADEISNRFSGGVGICA
jgi:hypothetical protein